MRTLRPLALALTISASLLACSSSKSHDVTVNWSDTKQTMDGFGASSAFFGQSLTTDQADQLFDPKKGIGLSLLRTMIGVPADTMTDGTEPTTGAVPTPTAPELTTAQQAAVRGCQVWAAAWTPPPIWKTTNSKNGSAGAGWGNQLRHQQAGSDALPGLRDLPDAVRGHPGGGQPAGSGPGRLARQRARLRGHLGQRAVDGGRADDLHQPVHGPAFAQKYPNVKIIAPETAGCPGCDPYITSLLANPAAASAVPIMAAHGYQGPMGNYTKPQKAGKSFWETEWSQENSKGDTPDPSMTSALVMAQRMHSDLVTTGMNAWNWWAIYITEDGLNDNTRLNPAFIQPDATKGAPYMFKRGYAFGNWSKFVRPGFQRLNASDNPNNGVYTEAYRDATHLAIIAINTNTSAVNQKFIVNGNTIDTLTPWVTSPDPNDNLVAKSPVTLTNGDFTFELPAQSVVTFVNWDATTETPGLTTIPGSDAGIDAPKIATCELNCSAAVVPSNVSSGGVTDFSDWNNSTGKWGSTQGLYGAIYGYAGPSGNASTMSASVDATNKDLHGVGSVASGGYAGIGLSYCACSTVASFSQVQFTVSGSWPGCDLQMQIKTFDQTPTSQNPMGGCTRAAATTTPPSCRWRPRRPRR